MRMFKWATFQEILLPKQAHLNILVHDLINVLYYEYWTDKQKYFYIQIMGSLLINGGSDYETIILYKDFKEG